MGCEFLYLDVRLMCKKLFAPDGLEKFFSYPNMEDSPMQLMPYFPKRTNQHISVLQFVFSYNSAWQKGSKRFQRIQELFIIKFTPPHSTK